MAPFNPDVKDVKPVNPIGWSKAAEVPSSFASALSEGIKGIGSVIEAGSKAGVELVQEDIKTAASEKFEPLVKDRISELAGEDFRLRLGAMADVNSPSSNASVLQGNVEDLAAPGDLKKEIKSLSILPDARANGKISPTDYYSRLMSAAADLRSRYPVGFRDYIDKEISKITGVDPANALMQSLTADINSFVTNTQAERNKISNEILNLHGKDPTAPQAYENFRNGGSVRDALNWIQRVKAVDAKHDRVMADLSEKKALSEADVTAAENSFKEFAYGKVATTSANSSAVNGLTSDRIRQITIDALSGKTTLTSAQAILLADAQKGLMEADRAALRKELDRVDLNPNSPTYRPVPLSRTLGDKGNKIIDDAMSGHKEIIQALSEGKTALALRTKTLVEALQNDTNHIYWSNPDFVKVFGPIKAFESAGGQSAVTQAWASIVSGGKLPDVQNASIMSKIAELSTAPDPRGPGFKEVNNFKEVIQKVDQESKKLNDDRYKFKTFNDVLGLIDGRNTPSITNPETKPEVVTNIFRNFFSPDTRGTLRLVAGDVRDPRTGNIVSGQESWFKRFTAPEVVAKANMQDPETKEWYLDWTQSTFKDLFSTNVTNLSSRELNGAYTVSWHPEDPVRPIQVLIKDPQTLADIRRFTGKSSPLEDDVLKLNKGVTGLFSAYRGLGIPDSTAERMVLEQLSLSLPKLKSINGIPENLINDMELKYKQKKAEEAATEQSKFEDKYKKFQEEQRKLIQSRPNYIP